MEGNFEDAGEDAGKIEGGPRAGIAGVSPASSILAWQV